MSSKLDNIIKRYEKIALSDRELLKIINGRAHLVLYPDLYKYNTIDEVLGPYEACILLFEWKPRYGHWVCLHKEGNTVYFFDPYSSYPDDSLDHVPDDFREESHQDHTYLTKLLLESPYDLDYNEYPFQRHDKNVKTCGRWCGMRLFLRDLSLEEFADLFYNDYGDELVTLLTMYINK